MIGKETWKNSTEHHRSWNTVTQYSDRLQGWKSLDAKERKSVISLVHKKLEQEVFFDVNGEQLQVKFERMYIESLVNFILSRLDDLEGPSLSEDLTRSFWNRPVVESEAGWEEDISSEDEREEQDQ